MAAGATPTKNDPKWLAQGQLTASDAVLYTAVTSERGTRVTKLMLVNDTTSNVTVTLWLSHGGGAGVDADLIAKEITIPADGMPVDIPAANGIILDADDEIRGLASTTTQVTYLICGIEMAA